MLYSTDVHCHRCALLRVARYGVDEKESATGETDTALA